MGIIPACAGSTALYLGERRHIWDHPRMCGEHTVECPYSTAYRGSSPHVRGALALVLVGAKLVGIIPACAGSTRRSNGGGPPVRDHPRMCGEHPFSLTKQVLGPGSSPHVRGALPEGVPHGLEHGIIPACAGSTGRYRRSRRGPRDHPRMCGEHLAINGKKATDKGSSPHVRGARSLNP